MANQIHSDQLAVAANQKKEEENYWLDTFSESFAGSNFPYDFKKNAGTGREMETVKYKFPDRIMTRLMKITGNSDIKRYITVVSGLMVLLNKYTGNDDIIFGTTIYKQKSDGNFINTVLPLRNRLDTGAGFRNLVLEMGKVLMEATQNRNYPIEKLLYKLNITHSPEQDFPLFDIAVLLENIHEKIYLNGINLNLIFSFFVTGDRLEVTVEYNKLLYRDTTIRGILQHLERVLDEALFNVDLPVARLSIMTPQEEEQVLNRFNDTREEYPRHKTLPCLFQEQVDKNPGNIAVTGPVLGKGSESTEMKSLSFEELNREAGRLAAVLRTKGVKADTVAAIMMDRSVETIIGILAILKAGGAYLPIDCDSPGNRKKFILEESEARVLLTQTRLVEDNPDVVSLFPPGNVLCLDDPQNNTGPDTMDNSEPHVEPGNLAYVLYTSGTSGTPKGVMIEHRNVNNLVTGLSRRIYRQYPQDEPLRVCLLSPFFFDASVKNIFASLLLGHSLYIAPEHTRLEGEKLLNFYSRHQIDISDGTPIHIGLLTGALKERNSALGVKDNVKHTVKHYLIGGEALPRPLVEEFFRWLPGSPVKIANVYGPTECCVDATSFQLSHDNITSLHTIPIGIPMPNFKLYIVDKDKNLLPPGIPGELCISGDGVGRGYLNNLSLTTKKFPANPFLEGERMYMTGDLAKWLPDGNIEYCGRNDQQVKIRGFRIELGEIENRLLDYHKIKEAAVLCREDYSGELYICAYIVPSGQEVFEKTTSIYSQLKEYLSRYMPDYMIPRYFMELEKLPVTSNGKTDRKALARLQVSPAELQKEYVPPRDQTEETLTRLWSDVLSIEQEKISIDANFFELGGHSLKATILTAKIHKEFNVKVPLAEIFKAPTIEALGEYLNKHLKGTAQEQYHEITPAEKKSSYPLSSAQKRLFLQLQINPGSTVYNKATVLTLEGKLDREKINEVFNRLIQRHESLRTSFHVMEGNPVQVIHDRVQFDIPYSQLDGPAALAAKSGMRSVLQDTAPFDLSKPPLMRVELLKAGDMLHYLKFDMHHIISDGSSSAIFIREFMDLYAGKQLPPLRIQYKDYSQWQNRERGQERIKKQEEYWLNTFEGNVPVLNLPADFSRPTAQSFEGKRVFFQLSAQETKGLNRLAREQGTTLYTVLLSFYYVLLHKLCQQEDIVIGAPTAGRTHDDLQNIIGMFLNTLALRNRPQPGKSFISFLNEVHTRVLEAFDNQDYQFDDLVDKLGVKRDAGRNPLFDVMFILQNLEIPEIKIPGLTAKPPAHDTATTKFDLSLYAVETGDTIDLNFNYSSKLFEQSTVEAFINAFKNIVSDVLTNPHADISHIRHISVQETRAIVEHFNRDLRKEAVPVLQENKVFQDKLNDIFSKYKDRTAIEYYATQQPNTKPNTQSNTQDEIQYKTLTYGELDRRSNYIANWILAQGIKKQSFIGILIDDRAELISTVLGIIKAGCVFVSLDSGYPDQRLEIMIETTRMNMIFIDQTNRLRFADNPVVKKQGVELRLFDTVISHAQLNSSWFVDIPRVQYHPDDRQYVLFTSGTTGTPKAIMGRNCGLLHYISWEIERFDLKDSIRIAQLSIPSFDPFLRDTFVALCSGGVVCIPPYKDIVMNPQALVQWMEIAKIQLIHCVPSLFKLINTAHLTPTNLKDLKYILLAGEKAVPSVLAAWYEIFDERIQLVNLLGPCETTLAKIHYLARKHDVNRVRIPVGKPIAGSAVILLNEDNNVCGPLEKGEICIRTPYRSCGYFEDQQLNDAKFIQNPFSDTHGDIVYRTGDMGMFLADGKLDMVGRADRQVKIRGRRIELEEIENLLLRHPSVKEAAVVKRETANNDELLCAYFVIKPAENPQSDDDKKSLKKTLTRYLSRRLPDYMVPTNIIEIEKLPRNTNGKVDHRQLPDPLARDEEEFVAPRDDIENRLFQVWKDLLKFQAIGVTDSFFEFGGNSLNAMSLTHKIHKEFDVNLILEDVFKNPTIESQSKLIRASIKDKYASIEKAGEKEYYALSSAQKRLYILQQMNPESTPYNIPKIIPLSQTMEIEKMEETFIKLINRHESLRTSFHLLDDEPVQRVHNSVDFKLAFSQSHLSWENESREGKDAYLKTFTKPFDLSQAPLLRAAAVKTMDEKLLMVVDMHHIISDGVSHDVLERDFMALYRGEELPPLRIQYKDYSEWQNSDIQKERMKQQESYWLNQFSGQLPVLNLPLDYPRPSVKSVEGSSVCFSLTQDEIRTLEKISTESGSTLYIVIFSVVSVLLSKLSGQEDIVIGTPIAGRGHLDLEHIIGMFVNTLPLRTFPSTDKTYKEYLSEVKKCTLDAFANQDFQFEDLVDKLLKNRDSSRNPMYDIVFNMLNAPDVKDESINLTEHQGEDTPYISTRDTTQFDINLLAITAGKRIHFKLTYCTKLFKVETIERFVEYFKTIISSLSTTIDQKLSGIDIISQQEQEELLTIIPVRRNNEIGRKQR